MDKYPKLFLINVYFSLLTLKNRDYIESKEDEGV